MQEPETSPLHARTVAVTGATGFLGRYIVDVLLERGARVIGAVRSPERVPALRERGVLLRRADLADRAALRAAFEGADAIVSNAAQLSLLPLRWRKLIRANVEGTENVFLAAAEAGVSRAVQISSITAHTRYRSGMDESVPIRGPLTRGHPLNAYALSKALSERRARELAQEHGIGLTVLRPPGMYGAFDATFTRAHRLMVESLPIAIYPCLMRMGLVYGGDVAEAVALSLEQSEAHGRDYNVTGEDRSAWEFARAWQRAGAPGARWLLPLPAPYIRRYDNTRIRQELGWQPRNFEAGIRDLLEREAS